LDGTGAIDGTDLTLYKQILSGQWSTGTLPGAATQMNKTLPVGSSVTGGSTIEVEVLSSGGKGRAGYGVMFWIDSSSTGSGSIYGGDGSGEVAGFPDGSRYDVTGTIDEGGKARVWLEVKNEGIIKINLKITAEPAKYLPAVPETGNMEIELSATP
jgi:hypothetical protein